MFRRRTALVAVIAIVFSFGAFFAGEGPASATGIPPSTGSQSCTSLVGVTKFHPFLFAGPSSLLPNHQGWKFTSNGLLSGCSNSVTFANSDVIIMGQFILSGYSTGQQNCSAPQALHVTGKIKWTAWDPTTSTIVHSTSAFVMQAPVGQAFNTVGSTTGPMTATGWFPTVTVNADWLTPAAVAANCASLTQAGGLKIAPLTSAVSLGGYGPPSLSA